MKTKQVLLLALLAFFTLHSALSTAEAQGTTFTYQGQLSASGSPANSNYDFTFALFNNSSTNTGQQIGTTQTNLDVGVTNGLFIVTLNFGDVFSGTNYWLAIGVRTNGGSTFTALNPLQEVTPTPYAIYASNAGTATNISGTIANSSLPASPSFSGTVTGNSFSGNGSNLTSLNASNLTSGTVADARLSTNVALLDKTQAFTGANTFNNSVAVATASGAQALNVSGSITGGYGTPLSLIQNNSSAANASPALRVVGYGNTPNGVLSVSSQGTGLIAQFGNASTFVASLDTNGNWTANSFSGNGSGLTSLNASQLTSGTVSLAQLPAAVVTNNSTNVNLTGSFAGNGAGVTNMTFGSLNDNGYISWGVFAALPPAAVGPQPVSVCAAVLNANGYVDLISANNNSGGSGSLSVMTNNGSGGFALSSTLTVGSSPSCVIAADVNGDGHPDLVCVNQNTSLQGTLSVYTNNGTGGFALSATLNVGTNPISVCAADVNGDGHIDLICANQGANPAVAGTVTVLTNNGSGGFALASSPTVGIDPLSVCAADVNGDGHIDLITANAGNKTTASTLTVLTNNGSGGFALSSSPAVGVAPSSVCAADVNGDGHIDLICANSGGTPELTVLTNNGSSGFVLSSTLSVGPSPSCVIAADVKGNGHVDLICANNGNSTLSIYTNNGTGGFALSASPSVGSFPESVVAADVNGDGRLDLVTANLVANSLSILLNEPAYQGSFSGNGSYLTGLNASQLTSGTIPLAQLPAVVLTNNENNVALSNLTLDGTLTLPTIATGTSDIIYAGSIPLYYSDANANLFGGEDAGNLTVSGDANTAYGDAALNLVTSGTANTALGNGALYSNLGGSENTACGEDVLFYNSAGSNNTVSGVDALYTSVSGSANTVSGYQAMYYTTTSSNNVAIGYQALYGLGDENSTGGNANIALGYQAGYNYDANESGNIDIGNVGTQGENNTIHIGTQGVQTTATIAGNVGIGTNNPGELLEVAGANAAIHVRNQNDPVGGFIGDTYYSLQLGMYNPSSTTEGLLSAGEKRSYFGCAYETGQVGSLNSDYGSPTFRNVLDDGSGNLTVSGKVGIGSGTSTPTYPLQMASGAYCSVAGMWTSVSDRNVKEDFTSIKPAEVLAKVAALPITQWKYKVEPNGIKHLGPVAQDFYSSFGLGDNDKAIGTVDESGVALAAIQGLNQKLDEKDAEIEKLKAKADKVDSLEKQLNELKQVVQLLADKK